MRSFDDEKNENDLEMSDEHIIERQALKFAQEFSGLYKSEKKKRIEMEVLSNELKERNEELMDIVFLASNQFLEPINNIESNLLLVKGQTAPLQEEPAGWFDDTQKSLKKLHRLVNEMSRLYKAKSLRSLFRPTSLDKILEEVIEELKPTLEKKGRKIYMDPLPVIETNSVQIRILFYQLIMLAIRNHWFGDSSVLTIKAGRNARGFWRITLSAQGMDFWGSDFGFEEFNRRSGSDRSLYICQRISQRLGGFLYEEKVSEKGFSCNVVLPEKTIPLASQVKNETGYY